MVYKDYFELVSQLLSDFPDLKLVQQSCNCNQWNLEASCINLVKLPDGNLVLAVVCLGQEVNSMIINNTILPVKFPLETISDSLKQDFDYIFKQLTVPHKGGLHDNQKNNQDELKHKVNDLGPKPIKQFTKPPIELIQSSKPFKRPNDMPDFDDELEINSQPSVSTRTFPRIGESDLNPPGLPKHPSLKQWHDPLADNHPSGDGGMYPTSGMFGEPNHGNTSRRGVPPGARFDDPYGEDQLQDIGMGLPAGLRRGPPGGPPGGPSGLGGPPGFGFGGFGPGGSSGF